MLPRSGIAAGMVRALLGVTALRDVVDVPGLLASVSLSPADLEDPEARVPREVVESLFERFSQHTGDLHCGLHLAALMVDVPEPDVLYYAARSSPTLGESIRRTVRYYHLLHDTAICQLDVEGEIAQLSLGLRHGAPARHAAEYILTMLYLRARRDAGPVFRLREVLFAHHRPDSTAEHEQIFEAPIRFEQPVNALIFDRIHLDRPLISSDPALTRILDRLLEKLDVPPTRPSGFADQVRRHVVEELKGSCPPMETIAARMHMSARSLQRRLQEQCTSYQDLLNDVRRDVALHHLGDSELAIGEVAFLLGFSDVSSFHRAFKRWTGQTPTEFRRQRRPDLVQ